LSSCHLVRESNRCAASEWLQAKNLPEDGQHDQHNCVDQPDRDQLTATFLANDGSTHCSSSSVSVLFALKRTPVTCRRALIAQCIVYGGVSSV
jgi:hypothetical protein